MPGRNSPGGSPVDQLPSSTACGAFPRHGLSHNDYTSSGKEGEYGNVLALLRREEDMDLELSTASALLLQLLLHDTAQNPHAPLPEWLQVVLQPSFPELPGLPAEIPIEFDFQNVATTLPLYRDLFS